MSIQDYTQHPDLGLRRSVEIGFGIMQSINMKIFLYIFSLAIFFTLSADSYAQLKARSSSHSGHSASYGKHHRTNSHGKRHSGSHHHKHATKHKSHGKHLNPHQKFHNKYYRPHPDSLPFTESNSLGMKGYGITKHRTKKHNHKRHRHKKHHNPHYYDYQYDPYYPGYTYYPSDYGVYGSTVIIDGYDSEYYGYYGRPSNLEVNGYIKPDYDQELYLEPTEEYYYEEPIYEEAVEPVQDESLSDVIYVWTDDEGVEHYTNDPDLIPEYYSDTVRVVGP